MVTNITIIITNLTVITMTDIISTIVLMSPCSSSSLWTTSSYRHHHHHHHDHHRHGRHITHTEPAHTCFQTTSWGQPARPCPQQGLRKLRPGAHLEAVGPAGCTCREGPTWGWGGWKAPGCTEESWFSPEASAGLPLPPGHG